MFGLFLTVKKVVKDEVTETKQPQPASSRSPPPKSPTSARKKKHKKKSVTEIENSATSTSGDVLPPEAASQSAAALNNIQKSPIPVRRSSTPPPSCRINSNTTYDGPSHHPEFSALIECFGERSVKVTGENSADVSIQFFPLLTCQNKAACIC